MLLRPISSLLLFSFVFLSSKLAFAGERKKQFPSQLLSIDEWPALSNTQKQHAHKAFAKLEQLLPKVTSQQEVEQVFRVIKFVKDNGYIPQDLVEHFIFIARRSFCLFLFSYMGMGLVTYTLKRKIDILGEI